MVGVGHKNNGGKGKAVQSNDGERKSSVTVLERIDLAQSSGKSESDSGKEAGPKLKEVDHPKMEKEGMNTKETDSNDGQCVDIINSGT
ncbi:hypothetical protein LWI28_006891 [Acer negundo]|uniref:Uncharacterized protein n=1 Tax=Acer negundo TaxID=4023 RepID=A0AAD5JGV8_ACENE|nr:hypothetical protein LWI28_006891 [Acer negundo]